MAPIQIAFGIIVTIALLYFTYEIIHAERVTQEMERFVETIPPTEWPTSQRRK